MKFSLEKERFDEEAELSLIGEVLVKGAIRTDAMAEGNVEIKMHKLVENRFLEEDGEVATQPGLDTQILKDVSRSFYLSLRFLPKHFRPSVSLGYLLARASDTIADAGELSQDSRKELLSGYGDFVLKGSDLPDFPEIKNLPPGEEVLLRNLDRCQTSLRGLPEAEKRAVRRVVEIIISGQTWDLERFDGEGLTCLQKDEELQRYTYQVAGCVGEFWTEIGFLTDSDFARLPEEEMNELGRQFGGSLQLINILRDVPEDLENGRCYLPCDGERESLLKERGRWIQIAEEGLESAVVYAEALSGKRLRFATALPALIGKATLAKLKLASWEEWEGRVKITRSEVRKLMWDAVRFSL